MKKTDTTPVLKVTDLVVEFAIGESSIRAADHVSWEVGAGRTLVILGESGSGKSVTVQAIAGILQYPGRLASGEIEFKGERVSGDPQRQAALRGADISMVLQDPLMSLNPAYRVGDQIVEMFRVHSKLSVKEARARAVELLRAVQIPDPEVRVRQYPHELSGGMRQRIMIAIALSQQPSVLIADEPTTALDATVQAQVINLLKNLQREFGMAIVLITHDIGVAAAIADDVAVMYAGRIVEHGAAIDVLTDPQHPYTRALLSSVPRVDGKIGKLDAIRGVPPTLDSLPPGCAFEPRCSRAVDVCRTERPTLTEVGGHRAAACHLVSTGPTPVRLPRKEDVA